MILKGQNRKAKFFLLSVFFLVAIAFRLQITTVNDSMTVQIYLRLPITRENNIFFIETNNNRTTFDAVSVCSYESAARLNPGRNIWVVLSKDSKLQVKPEVMLNFEQIRFAKVDFEELSRDTPAEVLFTSGKVYNYSHFSLSYISDALRLILLAKYGGVYLDGDVLSIKPLPKERNYIVAHSDKEVNGATMSFQKGHPFLTEAMKEMVLNFSGVKWGSQGPILLTKVLMSTFQDGQYPKSTPIQERQFTEELTVLPVNASNPVHFSKMKIMMDPELGETFDNMIRDSFAIHHWNHPKDNAKLYVQEEQNLYKKFKTFCPMTEATLLRQMIGKLYSGKSEEEWEYHPNKGNRRKKFKYQ